MLKLHLYNFFISILFILLTLDFIPILSIYGIQPNILLIFILFIGQKRGIMYAQVLGFMTGLILDLSSIHVGVFSLSMLIIGYIAGKIHYRFFVVGLKFQTFLLVFVLSLFYYLLSYSIKFLFMDLSFLHVIQSIFFESLYTALLAPILFYILDFLDYAINE